MSAFDRMCELFRRNGEESISGPGSSLAQTAEIRRLLPMLVADLEVKSLLDLPCGDFNWMQRVTLGVEDYVGADVLPHLIAQNQARYGDAHRRFIQLDLLTQTLPRADLILCRDCLVHFSFEDIRAAFRNLKRSGSTYLLMTIFPQHLVNTDIATGAWRPVNFERPPFNLTAPLRLIVENCTEDDGKYRDKSLGLWRLSDL